MNTQSINLRNQIRKKYKSEQSFFRCLSSWAQGMQIAFFLEAVFSSSFKSFIQALLLLVLFLSCFQCAVPTIYNNVPDQTFVDFLPVTSSSPDLSLRDVREVYSSVLYIAHIDSHSPSRLYTDGVQGFLWSPANLPLHCTPSILFLPCIICFLLHPPFYCWHQ